MAAAPTQDRFLGLGISPLTRRRLHNFRANKRGFWSLWIFLGLFVATLFAEFLANDRPFLVAYDGGFYLPILKDYPRPRSAGTSRRWRTSRIPSFRS